MTRITVTGTFTARFESQAEEFLAWLDDFRDALNVNPAPDVYPLAPDAPIADGFKIEIINDRL